MKVAGIHSLSDDNLTYIFGFLPVMALGRAAQVCKRWQRLAYYDRFYRNVTLSGDRFEPGTLGYVLARGTDHLTIQTNKFEAFKQPFFFDEFALGAGYRVKQLSVMALVRVEMMTALLSRCQQLRSVRLGPWTGFNPTIIELVARNSNLLDLKIDTNDLKFECVLMIARGCRSLRVFNWIGAFPIGSFTAEELTRIICELPPTMEETDGLCLNHRLTDEHVASMVQRLPNLKVVQLYGVPRLTATGIKHCFSLRKMEELNVDCQRNITNDLFRPLRNMPKMKVLRMYCRGRYGNKENKEALRKMLPKIRVLIYTN